MTATKDTDSVVAARRPRVLMLLGGDLSAATPVKASASSLAAAGLTITVLSYAADGRPKVSHADGVTLMEVPVPWHAKDASIARRQRRRTRRLRVTGFRDARSERDAKRRVGLSRSKLAAERSRRLGVGGPWPVRCLGAIGAWLREQELRLRSFVIRVRSGVQRRVDRQASRAWRLFDKLESHVTVFASWRRILPEVHDYELAYGQLIDELAPDVIHAQDVQIIAAAANAAERARARDQDVRWVYYAHECAAGLPARDRTPRWVAACRSLERTFIRSADRVITDSTHAAGRLQRNLRLPTRPGTVLDGPDAHGRPFQDHHTDLSATLVATTAELLGIDLTPTLSTRVRQVRQAGRGTTEGPARRSSTVVIGPANMAGQGWAWARAVERHLGIPARAFAVDRGFQRFPADELVSKADFAESSLWQLRQANNILAEANPVLIEAGRPVFGNLNGQYFDDDLPALRDASIAVALIFHGSEIRDPAWHAMHYPWSPFRNPGTRLTRRLQAQVTALKPKVRAFDGPKFVSTPDLLDDIPDAVWLPVVVDTTMWSSGDTPLERDRPLVVHAPSRRALKGTRYIDPVLERLSAEGLVDYVRLERLPNSELLSVITGADIVVDHIGIGNYGVFACEAMAAGRVTLSHIHERVRERVPFPVPVIEVRPDTLEAVLRRVVADREWAREATAGGRKFVTDLHDGRRSAEILASVLQFPQP